MSEEVKVSQISDFFIRWLLGEEGHEHLLLNFVNAFMLDADLVVFSKVSVINPYNFKSSKDEHETIVDVRAETDSGEVVIIEIQVRTDKKFADRSLYYWAKNYTKLEEERIKYHALKPIMCINVLNFNVDDDFDFAHTSYDIRCRETGRLLTDKFLMHFLELPKCISKMSNKDLIGWSKFLTSNNLEDDIMSILKENPVLGSAFNCYNKFRLDKELLTEYEKREMYLRQQRDLIIQGHAEGLEQGKIEIAKTMLEENYSMEVISKITGLSMEVLENL